MCLRAVGTDWLSLRERASRFSLPAVPGFRLVKPKIPALPTAKAVPQPREIVRKLRITRGDRSPMRVVFENAVVHEKFSLRARVVQRGSRLFFKPLMHWVPLSDLTIRTLRAADRKISSRGPRSRYVEPLRYELNGITVESQEHFYQVLWRGQAGDVIRIAVQRGPALHVIPVGSMDRYRLLRPPPR